jgi:hypothetical protein
MNAQEMSSSQTWQIIGRTPAGLSSDAWPPADWRDQLAIRLGHRPRRIGILAELALFGALDCLDAAKEIALPADVTVQVCSLRGSVSAISQALEQNQEGLAMPFSFLQSQTSQILPALAAMLNWQGDASVVLARNPMNLALLACQRSGDVGMLLGWVEETNPLRTAWLRLAPCVLPSSLNFVSAASFDEMIAPGTHYWQLTQAALQVA